MSENSLITQISLGGTILLCILGLAHYAYKQHNWLQNAGMMLIALGCGAKLWGDAAYVPAAHVGLFCYALGTAWRVYKFRPREPKTPAPPAEIPRDQMRHIHGGKG